MHHISNIINEQKVDYNTQEYANAQESPVAQDTCLLDPVIS